MSRTGDECPECGTQGDLAGRGYGSYHVFDCPECGNEWADDTEPWSEDTV